MLASCVTNIGNKVQNILQNTGAPFLKLAKENFYYKTEYVTFLFLEIQKNDESFVHNHMLNLIKVLGIFFSSENTTLTFPF